MDHLVWIWTVIVARQLPDAQLIHLFRLLLQLVLLVSVDLSRDEYQMMVNERHTAGSLWSLISKVYLGSMCTTVLIG
jgi:hypothetical protein